MSEKEKEKDKDSALLGSTASGDSTCPPSTPLDEAWSDAAAWLIGAQRDRAEGETHHPIDAPIQAVEALRRYVEGQRAAFQTERERLHGIIQDCHALIDPEANPELIERIDAVLTPCDESGTCQPPMEACEGCNGPLGEDSQRTDDDVLLCGPCYAEVPVVESRLRLLKGKRGDEATDSAGSNRPYDQSKEEGTNASTYINRLSTGGGPK